MFFNLLKVMEDKLEMKQFRLFLRTLRMTYNFYEVLSFDYQKQFEREAQFRLSTTSTRTGPI